jgi:multiple sugar transport system substrate-binding protein
LSELSRRKLLKYLAVGGLSAAIAGGIGYEVLQSSSAGKGSTTQAITGTYSPPSNATPEYSQFMTWLASASRPYAGEVLDISLEYEFSPLALQRIDPDFFNATGITNQYDLKPYYLHLADVTQMVRTSAPSYDLFSADVQDIASFKDYIISPTDLAEKYPDLTYEKLNSSNFQDLAWNYVANYPPLPYQTSGSSENVLFIPNNMATMIQFNRRDLYTASGLSPATNWTDYVNDAKTFMKSKATFGTVNEAAPNISIVVEFLNFLSSYGGSYWNVNGGNITSALNTESATAALSLYVTLRQFSDPTSYTYTWDEITSDLLRGIGASAIQIGGYAATLDDPSRSTVAGNIGYSLVPAGPKGSFSVYDGDGLGISKFSKHPEAAWLWLQWATALGTQEMNVLGFYHAFPSRKAVFSNSLVQENLSTDQYRSVNTTKEVWDSGNLATLLPFPQWPNLLSKIAGSLNSAWTGIATPADALSSAVQGTESIGSLTF